MKKQSLYRELAEYYDLIYARKNYKKEIEKINKLIVKHKKSGGKSLLEVACGIGNHLQYFKQNFSCTGTDINQGNPSRAFGAVSRRAKIFPSCSPNFCPPVEKLD